MILTGILTQYIMRQVIHQTSQYSKNRNFDMDFGEQ